MRVQWGAAGVLASVALAVLALAACIPGELTLESGDASSQGEGGADVFAEQGTGPDAGQDSPVDVGVFDAPPNCDAAGVSCVPAAPTGWTGPFAFYDGPAATAPPCAGNFPSSILDGHGPLDGSAGPAQCPACGCTAPSTGCPSNPTIQWYSDTMCTLLCTSSPGDASAGCPAVDVACSAVAFSVSGPSPGTCSASTGTPTLPPLPWGSTARACAPPALPQVDCPFGQLCSPVPPQPFGATMCISQAADVGACPQGAYSRRISAFSGASDTRGCTACACGSLQGFTCGAIVINPGNDCFGPWAITQSLPAVCATLGTYSGKPTYSTGGAAGPDAGSCTPSGGAAVGAVTPAPVTICCEP